MKCPAFHEASPLTGKIDWLAQRSFHCLFGMQLGHMLCRRLQPLLCQAACGLHWYDALTKPACASFD